MTIEGLRRRVTNFLQDPDHSRKEKVELIERLQRRLKYFNDNHQGDDSVKATPAKPAALDQAVAIAAAPIADAEPNKTEVAPIEERSEDGRKLIAKA